MERNILIDKLKGYACFLVLFGHVIMGIRVAGVNIPKFFEVLEKFIWSFHVPLFMFLSGVVYHITGEWKAKKTKSRFVIHKFLSLGVPYIVFSMVYILINSLVGTTNTQSSAKDILFIWKTPVAQYWFLYALFFLFCIWTVLTPSLKNWQVSLLLVLIGYVLQVLRVPIGALDTIFGSALAFGIGTFIDFPKLVKQKQLVKCVGIALHIGLGVLFIMMDSIEALGAKELMILLGIYASVMLISQLQNSKVISAFLTFMNKYSFQIYLLHTIFTAGTRIVLLHFNIMSWWIHVLLGSVLGIVCSVVVAEIAKRVWFLDFFFFPTKSRRMK